VGLVVFENCSHVAGRFGISRDGRECFPWARVVCDEHADQISSVVLEKNCDQVNTRKNVCT
jgi:hypothetical protein